MTTAVATGAAREPSTACAGADAAAQTTAGDASGSDRGSVGIVVVSHSPALAQAAVALARGLVAAVRAPVGVAAGAPGGGLGTDATAIAATIEEIGSRSSGVLVLMDLGSAVMSAQVALELLDDDLAARTHLSTAPLVEGLIGAYCSAGIGADLEAVAAQALAAATVKSEHVTPRP